MKNLDNELRKIVSKRRELPEHPEYIDIHMVSELSGFIRQREKELLNDFVKEIQKRADTTSPNLLLNEIVNYKYEKLKELSNE